MNKKQRVINAIVGKEVDHVPTCFSMHFEKEVAFGEKGIKSHLDFFKKTDTDVLKIMNEHLVPYQGEIKVPSDWNKIKKISLSDEFMQSQIRFIDGILNKCESDAFMINTLHGSVASSIHPIEDVLGYETVRELFCTHLRKDKTPIMDAFKRITEGMCLLAEKSIEMGLDGIYYAALGGENYYFTDEEFETHIAPLDKMVLKTVKDAGGYNILHMCKDHLNLKRYESYNDLIDVANWGVYEDNISLEEGKKVFVGTTILGGLQNRAGVIVDGSFEEIAKETIKVINEQGKKNFMLGADCTLGTDLPYNRIKAIVDAARTV